MSSVAFLVDWAVSRSRDAKLGEPEEGGEAPAGVLGHEREQHLTRAAGAATEECWERQLSTSPSIVSSEDFFSALSLSSLNVEQRG